MPAIGTTTLLELDAALVEAGAQLTAREVHALFLGGMSSTNTRFGPQHLLEQILGDGPTGDDPPLTLIVTILGYWNHLADERAAGRVRFVPMDLPAGATQAELTEYANCRQNEIEWYLRGLAAGGDTPRVDGSARESILKRIAEARLYIQGVVKLLGRGPFSSAEALAAAHNNLVAISRTIEGIIADLIEDADRTRRSAVGAFTAASPGDVPVRRGPKIGRNEPCPCGSGKK
jgi:hypothetical protein